MSTDDQNLFRLTAWPPEPLPVPRVWVYPVTLTDDGFLQRDRRRPKSGRIGKLVAVPDELYLRGLRELRLDDALQVAAFVNEHGTMGTPEWADLPPDMPADASLYFEGAPIRPPGLRATIDGKFARYRRDTGLQPEWHGVTHVDVFGVYARLLRDLVRILEAYQGLLTLDDVVAQWESEWTTPVMWRDGGMHAAVAFMVECLHRPLRDFHARLEIREDAWPEQDLMEAHPSLFSVLCLQMWNHIAQETPYRVCQREDCRRLFVRQQGRAKHGQFKKTGSMYCTVQCARLVSVRKFREGQRRAAAEAAKPPKTKRKSGPSR